MSPFCGHSIPPEFLVHDRVLTDDFCELKAVLRCEPGPVQADSPFYRSLILASCILRLCKKELLGLATIAGLCSACTVVL